MYAVQYGLNWMKYSAMDNQFIIASEWKLFWFDKLEVYDFEILLIDVNRFISNVFKSWYLMC